MTFIDAYKIGILSFLITFFLVPFFCWLSRKYKFVDIPDGFVKTHERPVSNLGGLAIYLGFMSSCLLYSEILNDKDMLYLLIGATLFLIIGLIDDRICLKPIQKFLGQCLGATFFITMGLYYKAPFFSNVISILISFLWILTIANAFNLIDIMDGLATLVAICITITLLAIAFYMKISLLILVLAALLGVLCSFLYYNKPVACIYLGDAGALFIGSLLGTIIFLFPWSTFNPYGYLIPFCLFAIPLYELLSLIVIRTYKKVPFYLPSQDHFCLYLIRNGWSKKNILWYITLIFIYLYCISFLFFIQAISLIEASIICALLFLAWIHFLTSRTS